MESGKNKKKATTAIIIVMAVIAVILLVLMIFLLLNGADRKSTDSGECGDEGGNVTWTLYDDGEIVISGEGAMANYTAESPAPWYKHRAVIKAATIKSGVTSVGDNAFRDCEHLAVIHIADTVETIGEGAFEGCTSLEEKPSLPSGEGLASGIVDIEKTQFCKNGGSIYAVINGVLGKYTAELVLEEEIYGYGTENNNEEHYFGFYGGRLYASTDTGLIMYNPADSSKETYDVAYEGDMFGVRENMLYAAKDGTVKSCNLDTGSVETVNMTADNDFWLCGNYIAASPAYGTNDGIKIYSIADGSSTSIPSTTEFDIVYMTEEWLFYVDDLHPSTDSDYTQLYRYNLSTGDTKSHRIDFLGEPDPLGGNRPVTDITIFNNKLYFINGHFSGSAKAFGGRLYCCDKIEEFTFSEVDAIDQSGYTVIGSRFYQSEDSLYISGSSGLYHESGLRKINDDDSVDDIDQVKGTIIGFSDSKVVILEYAQDYDNRTLAMVDLVSGERTALSDNETLLNERYSRQINDFASGLGGGEYNRTFIPECVILDFAECIILDGYMYYKPYITYDSSGSVYATQEIYSGSWEYIKIP